MATGYQYRAISNFELLKLTNIGDSWSSNHQKCLDIPGSDDNEHSTIEFLGRSEHSDFLKYRVIHETMRREKARFGNNIRNNFIGIYEFNLFIPNNYSYLYADTNTRNCDELAKRIKECFLEFEFKSREVDLLKIKSALYDNIRGGWFKNLEIADVSAAGIFGANVGDSEDWTRYENNGQISALTVEFKSSNMMHSIQITRTGTIILYGRYSESYSIRLVEEVNDYVGKFSDFVKT